MVQYWRILEALVSTIPPSEWNHRPILPGGKLVRPEGKTSTSTAVLCSWVVGWKINRELAGKCKYKHNYYTEIYDNLNTVHLLCIQHQITIMPKYTTRDLKLLLHQQA